jgi:3-deoxy-7-phosphoheptulonate synthase/chorismate mutase
VTPSDDPLLRELREQISATDRAILDAVNARLELVARIKEHKGSRGIGFLDPEREQSMVRELTAANSGPLSDEGVRELLAGVLDLTKREVARREELPD